MIPIIAAAIASAVLLAMSVIQVLVAAGRPYGAFVYGGQHRVVPRRLRIMSAVTVLLYGGIAAVLFAGAGLLPGQDAPFVRVAIWVLFAFFTLSIALNAISRSRPERMTATPASAVLSISTLILALGTQ